MGAGAGASAFGASALGAAGFSGGGAGASVVALAGASCGWVAALTSPWFAGQLPPTQGVALQALQALGALQAGAHAEPQTGALQAGAHGALQAWLTGAAQVFRHCLWRCWRLRSRPAFTLSAAKKATIVATATRLNTRFVIVKTPLISNSNGDLFSPGRDRLGQPLFQKQYQDCCRCARKRPVITF